MTKPHRRAALRPPPPAPYEIPLTWPEAPCGLHWPPVWSDERLEFIGREFTAGTPIEVIDQCALEMDGRPYTPDDLHDLIEFRGWQRPPDWTEQQAWTDFNASMLKPIRGALGPFGVAGYHERPGPYRG